MTAEEIVREALAIAASICVYTNDHIQCGDVIDYCGGAAEKGGITLSKLYSMKPKEIVAELDKYIIGQDSAKKSVAIALRNRYRRSQLDEEMREEITPKNILMMGPTGVGKDRDRQKACQIDGRTFCKG